MNSTILYDIFYEMECRTFTHAEKCMEFAQHLPLRVILALPKKKNNRKYGMMDKFFSFNYHGCYQVIRWRWRNIDLSAQSRLYIAERDGHNHFPYWIVNNLERAQKPEMVSPTSNQKKQRHNISVKLIVMLPRVQESAHKIQQKKAIDCGLPSMAQFLNSNEMSYYSTFNLFCYSSSHVTRPQTYC